MSNYAVSDSDLTTIADAIRTKGGTSAGLSFPDGFVSAIGDIPTGGTGTLISKSITANGTYNAADDDADGYSSVTVNVGLTYESGTFTTPSSGSTYTLTFSNTYSKYLICIEATDDTKAAIIASGVSGTRTFALVGIYPKRTANNATVEKNTLLQKINPSTNVADASETANYTYTDTSITMSLGNFNAGANYLYTNCSYNYYIVEIP